MTSAGSATRATRATRSQLALLAGLALLAALGGCRDQPAALHIAAGVSELHIASWNLAWLSERDQTGTIKRSDADYQRLARYADRLDADIIAFQEVASAAAAARVFDPARYQVLISKRSGAQRTGFAYKKTLRVTRYPDLTALDVGGLRHGVDIGVELGETSLRLLSVHLKSGCFADPLSRDSAACSKLARQVPALEAWIDARARADEPFVVLGDFNRRMDADDMMWRDLDDGDPAPLTLTLTTAGQRSRCWGGQYPEFIDHIVLGSQATGWLLPGSFAQLVYDEPAADKRARKRISDHCPISVRLRPALAAEVPGRPAEPPAAPIAAKAPRDASAQRAPPTAAAPPGGGTATETPPTEAAPSAQPPAEAKPSRPGERRETGPMSVKGNVSRGRKLYHLPSCPSYAQVRIDERKGERYFATEEAARRAGFRKAGNCP
ncbi:MAG: hypothetical protein Tsb0020_25330 [Haliangiales bacterium]